MPEIERIVIEEYGMLRNRDFSEEDEIKFILAPHVVIEGCRFRKVKILKHPKYRKKDYLSWFPFAGYVPNVLFHNNVLEKIEIKGIPIEVTHCVFISKDDWLKEHSNNIPNFEVDTNV